MANTDFRRTNLARVAAVVTMIGLCRLFCAFAVAAGVAACGSRLRQLTRRPEGGPNVAAMAKVDRAAMGLTDIPADAPMRLESRRRAYPTPCCMSAEGRGEQ